MLHYTSYQYRSECLDLYNKVPLSAMLGHLLDEFAVLNPHATFTLTADEEIRRWRTSQSSWSKWRTSFPTSPHWYDPQHLTALIAGYVAKEVGNGTATTVREFVSQFDGLRRPPTQKAVVERAGLAGCYLHDLVRNDAIVGVDGLLAAMREHSRPVKPAALGTIGREHLECRLTQLGAIDGSFNYRKVELVDNGLPFVIEVAFAQREEDEAGRIVIPGLNWSPLITDDLINLMLIGADIARDDPVILMTHVVSPRFDIASHGKANVVLPDQVEAALEQAIEIVCKPWTTAKKRNERERHAAAREMERRRRAKKGMNIKDAALEVMEKAYMEASANDTLPANSRQIMYSARPLIMELTGGKIWKHSSYFTQHLLPDFVEENPDLTETWDIIYDDRGHVSEPHVGRRLGIGTIAIRDYIDDWTRDIPSNLGGDILEEIRLCRTNGPANRYRFVLFIEKEGFDALLDAADIASRYDLALMSTKGMSVTACRELVRELSREGITTLLAHDFDSWGCTIASTISHDTRRFRFEVPPRVIDLGLRLDDIKEMALQSEPVQYKTKVDPRTQLRSLRLGTGKDNRLTTAEVNMLVASGRPRDWNGQRVELNAMPADVFVNWLESKLEQAGVKKVVPSDDAAAWHRQRKRVALKAALDRINETYSENDNPPPPNLRSRVSAMLRDYPTKPWDEAVADLAESI